MGERISVYSDLTGKDIGDDSEHATLIVLSHPTIDRPVRLDAFVLEVRLPNEEPEKLWIQLAKFDKLFAKDVDPQEVLENAKPAYQEVTVRKPGRPRKEAAAASVAPKTKRDPALLNQIRDWARQNGWPELGSRGRIP